MHYVDYSKLYYTSLCLYQEIVQYYIKVLYIILLSHFQTTHSVFFDSCAHPKQSNYDSQVLFMQNVEYLAN